MTSICRIVNGIRDNLPTSKFFCNCVRNIRIESINAEDIFELWCNVLFLHVVNDRYWIMGVMRFSGFSIRLIATAYSLEMLLYT